MGRAKRELKAGYCYHITIRCNNRDFNLASRESREIYLYILKKAQDKYPFKLYALCLMLNHVHLLVEPDNPHDLPKMMHWINWYSAMSFNALLGRKGHFWEQRYSSHGFPLEDKERAINTIRYIHANPKAAKMRQGFFYDFSNYGTYENLTDDGLTQWHPAFLELGNSLEECAKKYKGFCQRYRPKKKKHKANTWGNRLLSKIRIEKRKKPIPPGQIPLPFAFKSPESAVSHPEIKTVALAFIKANRYAC